LSKESRPFASSSPALGDLDTGKTCVVRSPDRPRVSQLDSFPTVDRTLIDFAKYARKIGMAFATNVVCIMATLGCPYRCAYCHRIWPRKRVARSPESLLEEIELYYSVGVRRFSFLDDAFNSNVKWSARFFRLLAKSNMKVQLFFPNGLRGDLLTPDYIDLMVEAGTVHVILALETGSARLQKLIRKNLDLDKFRRAADYITTDHPQIRFDMFFMMGFPTETEEEVKETLDFAMSIQWLHFPFMNVLKIYPETEMAAIARENGVSEEAIRKSISMEYHDLPHTMPFPKTVARKAQMYLYEKYFLNPERIRRVLPVQLDLYSETELIQIYDSYLPAQIRTFDDLLARLGLSGEETTRLPSAKEIAEPIPDINSRLRKLFPRHAPSPEALRILLLDVSCTFSSERGVVFDNVVEQPLGLMSLLTYLNHALGDRITGRIAKSHVDFDSFDELRALVEEFCPQIIGLRALTRYSGLFHRTATQLKGWLPTVPIIAGGPYATSSPDEILQDTHVDVVVIGEGEITLAELSQAFIDNQRRLPAPEVLEGIPGVAFRA